MLAPSVAITQHSSHPCAHAPPSAGSLRSFDIQNSLTLFADLNYFSFFFERREIARCRCVRDMQELFYFVVGNLACPS